MSDKYPWSVWQVSRATGAPEFRKPMGGIGNDFATEDIARNELTRTQRVGMFVLYNDQSDEKIVVLVRPASFEVVNV